MPTEAGFTAWSNLEVAAPLEGVSCRVLHGSALRLARVEIAANTCIETHTHPVEVLVEVISGRIEIVVDSSKKILEAGELVRIPPNIEHSAEALSDTILLEAFPPPVPNPDA